MSPVTDEQTTEKAEQMKEYDIYYRGDTRIMRIAPTDTPDIYEVFYLDNDGTGVVNWAETFYGLSALLAEIEEKKGATE